MKKYFPSYIPALLWCILVLTCCNLILIGWLGLTKKDLKFALDDLARCESEATGIEVLRKRVPVETSSVTENSSEVASVRSALEKTKIDESSIQMVAIRGRSQIKKTTFEKVDTTLVLKNALLADLLNFIDVYERENSDSVCSKLEIRVGDEQGSNASVVGVADLTLTQLVRSSTN